MYAVIFETEARNLGNEYQQLSSHLRELAFEQYGCRGLTSATEGNKKITISYWDSLESIRNWKQNNEHLQAQALGKEKFFEKYRIQVVEILREYEYSN
jgi:heme-degrading monooxygenase HmoA